MWEDLLQCGLLKDKKRRKKNDKKPSGGSWSRVDDRWNNEHIYIYIYKIRIYQINLKEKLFFIFE